ncbi:beta-lactamase-like protein [Bisporella sp. PMI_857]|nr:beta-lactamase-like protein [Bisporella sp. PMI_857]
MPAPDASFDKEYVGVSIIETGKVQIRPSMRSQTANRLVLLRRLVSLADRQWTEPLPITAILISHPEGPFLYDTGESVHRNDRGYFPRWAPFSNMLSKVQISQHEGIGARLRARGIDPVNDVKGVVLSHLHDDHAGGLEDLPGVPVYVSQEHWDVFGNNTFHATFEGCNPSRWPADFKPRMLEAQDHPIGPWQRTYPLTSDKRVVVVDTPGHVPGHVSVIVYGDEATYFLTGDSTYGLDVLNAEETDGINDNPKVALESVRKIKEFTRQEKVVVLPAHDPNVEDCLANKKIFVPSINSPS